MKMKKQVIFPSDQNAGSLRCQTCETLYYCTGYDLLIKEGCRVCGQDYEFATFTREELNKAFTDALEALRKAKQRGKHA